MIYRHDRIEISNLTNLTISQLYNSSSDTRRHRTTSIDFRSTISKLYQRPIFLHNRNTHSKIHNFKVWNYLKFRPELAGNRRPTPAAGSRRSSSAAARFAPSHRPHLEALPLPVRTPPTTRRAVAGVAGKTRNPHRRTWISSGRHLPCTADLEAA